MSSSNKLFVVAIDFGTTYSGYAFSSISRKEQVYTYNWSKGIGQYPKTPTTILFTPQRDFDSFGYEAEEKYARLSSLGQNRSWYFYKRFKLTLYKNENLNEYTNIDDFTGKSMPAIDVFSNGIQYLKEHLFKEFEKWIPVLCDEDIHWVLTVPAIWDEKAKKFMRKAGEKAGIPGNNLTLALEPESASLYCQLGTSGFQPLQPGEKFLLLDCGGGTVDVTVHEVRHDKSLKEIHRASGGTWGGINVDDAFQEYLFEVFGFEAIASIPKNEVIELENSFESLKKKVDGENRVYNMPMPLSLRQVAGDVTLIAGRTLRIDSAKVKGFFDKPINKICSHIRQIISTLCISGLKTIVLVGGFSESPLLQEKIRNNFPFMNIKAPAEPGSAVVKGAVEFGHSPEKIRFRLSPFTFGVASVIPFQRGVHPTSKHFYVDGEEYCHDIFDVHVKIGQQVETGTAISDMNYVPIYPNQTCLRFKVLASHKMNPSFIDEPGCNIVGRFNIQVPTAYSGLDRSVNVKMIFSGTELKVEARDENTGQKYDTSFRLE